MRKIDLIGQVFTYWTVLGEGGRQNGKIMWLCRCKCGNEKIIDGTVLKYRRSVSCGCLRRERCDLVGNKYGHLTVLSLHGVNKSRALVWLCHCECGKDVIVPTSSLKKGNTKSCGCFYVRGSKHGNWRSNKHITSRGYVRMSAWGHPNSDKGGRIFEHVLVMSQIIGRPLIKGETVHHKNGVRNDNSPENLELRMNNHGPGQRIEDLVPYWKKMLELYEPIILKLNNDETNT